MPPRFARTRPLWNASQPWLHALSGIRGDAPGNSRTLELDPEMAEARACLSRALLYGGDARGAIDAIRSTIPQDLAGELAALPADRAARRLMELALHRDGRQDPYERAWRLAWLGSGGEALTALEEAFQSRSLMIPLAAVDPAFAAIREEPRFRKIVTDMGLR